MYWHAITTYRDYSVRFLLLVTKQNTRHDTVSFSYSDTPLMPILYGWILWKIIELCMKEFFSYPRSHNEEIVIIKLLCFKSSPTPFIKSMIFKIAMSRALSHFKLWAPFRWFPHDVHNDLWTPPHLPPSQWSQMCFPDSFISVFFLD